MAGLGDMFSGILGGDAGKDDMKKSLELANEAREELRNVYVPTTEEQKILLQNQQLAGLLDAEQLGDSAMEQVSVDPRMKNAQMKALEELAGLSETGLGAEDKYAFNQLRREANAAGQAQQASILQNAAASGTLDSGNAMMAQLQAAQGQANRMSQGAEAQAAQAAAARRQALGMYAQQGNAVAQQDFAQKSAVGNAKDAISKFNAQNRQGVNQYNLGNRQNISNANTATANQQEMHNKGLIQQKYQNDLGKATGVAGQTNNLANQYATQGAAAAQGQANMMSGILGTAGTIGGAMIAGPAGAAAGGQIGQAASGKGQIAADSGSYDDYYMNKVK